MDRLGVSRLLAPRPTPVSATPGQADPNARPKPQTGRFMFGLLILYMSTLLIQTGLLYLNTLLFKGALSQTLAPARANVPLLSGLSWFILLFVVLTLGVWWLLTRFNIIPRDPFGARARTEAQRATLRQTTAATTAAAGRNRAARRAVAEAQATAPARTSGGRAKGTTAAPAAKGARATASVAATTTSTAGPRPETSGPHDASYQRVKAAQRARRRRDGKR